MLGSKSVPAKFHITLLSLLPFLQLLPIAETYFCPIRSTLDLLDYWTFSPFLYGHEVCLSLPLQEQISVVLPVVQHLTPTSQLLAGATGLGCSPGIIDGLYPFWLVPLILCYKVVGFAPTNWYSNSSLCNTTTFITLIIPLPLHLCI